MRTPSGHTLWEATAMAMRRPWPTLRGEIAADVAIIGAGFTGLSTALAVARLGCCVAILESSECGAGASGRNAAGWGAFHPRKLPSMIEAALPGDAGHRLVAFIAGSGRVLQDLVAREQIACDFKRSGIVVAAHTAAASTALEVVAREWTSRGSTTRPLDSQALADLFGTRRFSSGVHFEHAGTIQPLSLVRGLADRLIDAGAHAFARSPALRLERSGSCWRVGTPNGSVRAPHVVLATDAYAQGRLWPGLRQSLIHVPYAVLASAPLTERQQAAVSRSGLPLADSNTVNPLWVSFDRDRRLVTSSMPPLIDALLPVLSERVARRIQVVFPELDRLEWSHRWLGTVGISNDEMPRIASLAPGLWAPGAYSGQGIAQGIAMGLQMAALLATHGETAIDVPVFPLRRVAPMPRLIESALRVVISARRARDTTYRA